MPDGASRLFDLISPNEETFRCAFYFAIKDTLVVKNLATATAMAYEGDKAK